MKKLLLLFLISVPVISKSQDLKLNEREYYERQGINVLVFSNNFNGGFNDEKNSGIEIIHHDFIQYGNTRSNDFIIDDHVYDKITDATTDVWVPIHMNHMYVNEGTIAGNTQYVIFGSSFKNIVTK